MKLVIKKESGYIYACRESNKHYKVVEPQRSHLKRLDPNVLDYECDLGQLQDNSYIVFDIKKKKKRHMGIEELEAHASSTLDIE